MTTILVQLLVHVQPCKTCVHMHIIQREKTCVAKVDKHMVCISPAWERS